MSHEQPMSFAQALNEAKQYIVQQSNRIKSDAEKIKAQQQTIVDQCASLTEHDRKGREQGDRLAQMESQVESLKSQLAEQSSARAQAEAVCDRQGERITHMQYTLAEFEKKSAEQADVIAKLTSERDELHKQMPTKEDEAALAELTNLLTTKRIPSSLKSTTPQTAQPGMRIGEQRAEAA